MRGYAPLRPEAPADGGLEHLLVPGRAAVYEIVLDQLSVPLPEPAPQKNVGMDGANRIRERRGIVQLDHETCLAARQEVGLPAAVVTEDRQAAGHGFQEHQAEPFVLAGRDESVGDRERCILVRVGNLPRQVHALRNAELGRSLPDRGGIRAVADDQQVSVGDRAGGQHVDELRRRLARDQPADRDHDERIVRQAEGRARRHYPRRRALDPERNQSDFSVHAVQLVDVAHGIARLPDYVVGRREHPAYGRAQGRVQMGRRALAGIEQIAAVHRQHVRQVMPARQRVAERSGRHHEVRVDHVEARSLQRQSTNEAARQVREHGREVRDCELAAKEHRHAYHAHALIVGFRGEVAGARSEHCHFVATRQLARQRCHHDTAAAAEGRVFVVTKQDAHQYQVRASSMPERRSGWWLAVGGWCGAGGGL